VDLTRRLRAVLGGDAQVNDGPSARSLHARDASFHAPVEPDVVVFPAGVDDVCAVLELADALEVPVTPWGMGTSVEGNAIPVRGGISLSLQRMDAILDVDATSRTARVQAGVTRLALQRRVGPEGLCFPVDPGADASLGGMAATNAAGTTTLRYGKMREQVRGLEVVLAGGRRISTGTAAAKTSAGYDLTSLMVGSEGTLGVIVELVVGLHPIEEASASFRFSVPRLAAAGDAAAAIAGLGLPLLRLELMDAWEVRAVTAFTGLHLAPEPLVLGELAGPRPAVEEALAGLEAVVGELGGRKLAIARDRATQTELWRARHDAYFAELDAAPMRASLSTDVCVPLAALGATLAETRRAIDEAELTGGIVAHAGDGNVHVGLMVDPADADDLARARRLVDRLVEAALARGGTCTGEHGVGIGKRAHLALEHGDSVDLMRAIKRAFDPRGILNPGKVLPEEPT
jgi:D-lactate dehydrogenase (cytochrome)